MEGQVRVSVETHRATVAPVHHGDGAENMRKGHGTTARDSSGKSKAACYVVALIGRA
jgi:hypothetical protein